MQVAHCTTERCYEAVKLHTAHFGRLNSLVQSESLVVGKEYAGVVQEDSRRRSRQPTVKHMARGEARPASSAVYQHSTRAPC
jgi:hypothetical protein